MGTRGKWAPEKMDTRASGHLEQMSTRAKLEQMGTSRQMGILGINGHVGDWDKKIWGNIGRHLGTKWALGPMGTWRKWAAGKMDTRATGYLGQMSTRAKLR